MGARVHAQGGEIGLGDPAQRQRLLVPDLDRSGRSDDQVPHVEVQVWGLPWRMDSVDVDVDRRDGDAQPW